ncbi:hypothetical protein EON77_17550, partial [bacterium]
MKTLKRSLLFAAVAVSLGAFGCFSPSGSSPNDEDEALPENTGAIRASLAYVPSDVRCVEISTGDWRTPFVAVDVTPGEATSIRLAPLSPGYVAIWGRAYAEPCNAQPVWPAVDAGSATTPPYWG